MNEKTVLSLALTVSAIALVASLTFAYSVRIVDNPNYKKA